MSQKMEPTTSRHAVAHSYQRPVFQGAYEHLRIDCDECDKASIADYQAAKGIADGALSVEQLLDCFVRT